MLFLYSDAGSHFKHNKILHQITYGLVFIQVKSNKDKHKTATGWPRPLNRGGRLIQVTNAAFI